MELPRYSGSFWKLDELKKFVQEKYGKGIISIELWMNNSNKYREDRKKKKEDELQRPIPKSDYGDRRLKYTKGENGLKLNKLL